MPRGPRLDISGLIYHVMCRGIERSIIFNDDYDREQLLTRISKHAGRGSFHVYAFSLMPNHFHLLVRPLDIGLATFMRRVLTGYAVYFNRRHKRSGHLFQNRYKSIVVEEEAYLLELVRYIHLNPLRGGVISNLEELSIWPYSGYSALIGKAKYSWFEADHTLSLFGARRHDAREKLSSFMKDGLGAERCDDLVGGGLKRSLGLISDKDTHLDGTGHQAHDERILGSGDFVEAVLRNEDRPAAEKKGNRSNIHGLIEAALSSYSITLPELCSGSKRSAISKARSTIIALGVKHFGLLPIELSEALGISLSAVYSIISRSREEYASESILDVVRRKNV